MNDGFKVKYTRPFFLIGPPLKKSPLNSNTMAAEKKTKGVKLETIASVSLKKKFKARCKKLNVSVAQRLRDLAQKDIKGI